MPATPVILITGGCRGLGASMADALRPHARVYVTSRQPLKYADALSLDVTQAESVQQVFKTLVTHHGQVDILINNAGIGFFKSIADLSLAEWQQAIDTNLTGAFLCSQAFFRTNRQGGRIINMGSIVDQRGVAGNMGYAPSKWGLRGLSEALNAEGNHRQIFCTHVSLGAVATGMGQDPICQFDPADMLAAQDVALVIRDVCLAPPSIRIDQLSLYPPKGLL